MMTADFGMGMDAVSVCRQCGGLGYDTDAAGQRRTCRCRQQQQMLAAYPFLKNVKWNQVDLEKLDRWLGLISGKEIRDLLMEVDGTDHEIWALLGGLLAHERVEDYELLDVFELVDIVYMRHPKYDSFWKIKAPVVVLVTGFNRYSTTTPHRLADWVCQLWDSVRFRSGKLILAAWLNEVMPEDLQLWRDFAARRGIERINASSVPKKGGCLYAH